MGDIKPVVTEKYVFEYRGNSIQIAFSGFICLSGTYPKKQNHSFFIGIFLYK